MYKNCMYDVTSTCLETIVCRYDITETVPASISCRFEANYNIEIEKRTNTREFVNTQEKYVLEVIIVNFLTYRLIVVIVLLHMYFYFL